MVRLRKPKHRYPSKLPALWQIKIAIKYRYALAQRWTADTKQEIKDIIIQLNNK